MNIPASMEIFDDVDRMQQSVAREFGDLVTRSLSTADVFRVSLSGGSTPKRIYELIADLDLPWHCIHWFWGDERNVLIDHDDSNARMVREALLDRINAPSENVHFVPVDPENPAEAAEQYERVLRNCFDGDAFPRWDLNLLGMGDDAHTASLFPQTTALEQTERWFVENWVEKLDSFRYTLTAPAINSAQNIWFLVAGAAKQPALARVLSDAGNPDELPSKLIRPTRWFVTQDTLAGI